MTTTIDNIKAAYAEEVKHRHPPVTADHLPLSYEEITPQWLTAVLCGKVSGAKVVSHRLGPADDGNSNRRRIYVEYNEAGKKAGLPERLFCKATQGLANRISLGPPGCIQAEVSFYKDIRPLLDIEAPICHFANMNPQSLNSIIMLGDLGEQTTFCTHTTEINRDRVQNQLGLLARYHGQFLEKTQDSSLTTQFPTWSEFFGNIDYPDYEEACDKGFAAAEEVIPPRLYARRREIWPATRKSVECHKTLPHTLTHGDDHLRNWYITPQGKMGLSDWQAVTRSHWSRDLAYVMATSLTVKQRRQWERELLRYYIDELQVASEKPIGYDDVFDHYRRQLMSVLTFWTITLNPAPGMPDFQPRDSTIEFIRRIVTAIDDLEVLDSF